MFLFSETSIPGSFVVKPRAFVDERGSFTKIYHKEIFEEVGIDAVFKEEFYSISRKDVIRGMHFQSPPMDHAKLIYCVNGKVLDVFLDIRKGSPTYGRVESVELGATGDMVYLPAGIAHGFCTLTDSATMVYKVTSVHSKESDDGVLWNSIDFSWPTLKPIVSNRDNSFKSFSDFESPFQ